MTEIRGIIIKKYWRRHPHDGNEEQAERSPPDSLQALTQHPGSGEPCTFILTQQFHRPEGMLLIWCNTCTWHSMTRLHDSNTGTHWQLFSKSVYIVFQQYVATFLSSPNKTNNSQYIGTSSPPSWWQHLQLTSWSSTYHWTLRKWSTWITKALLSSSSQINWQRYGTFVSSSKQVL